MLSHDCVMNDVVPALPSATVMLVRDVPRFEVLMVQRHHQIEFASGALVFPGGKLEQSDHDPAWSANVTGAEDLSGLERALRICAIREAFEESGILLVGNSDGNDAIETRAAAGRDQVASGQIGFREFVGELGLTLDLAALTPFARWITPSPMKKRFDTHFFVMAAPLDQVAACDGYEMYAIAATVLGGTSLSGGRGSVGRAMFGVAIIAVINNGMNLMHINSYWQKVVIGLIILLAVILDMAQFKKEE